MKRFADDAIEDDNADGDHLERGVTVVNDLLFSALMPLRSHAVNQSVDREEVTVK
jgi:hypothetical protein